MRPFGVDHCPGPILTTPHSEMLSDMILKFSFLYKGPGVSEFQLTVRRCETLFPRLSPPQDLAVAVMTHRHKRAA